MPKKIKNSDIPLLWAIAKESILSVNSSELFYELEYTDTALQLLQNCRIENPRALMHWSKDLLNYTANWEQKNKLGWTGTNALLMGEYLAGYCFGLNGDAYNSEFYDYAEDCKFYLQAPYVFWAPGRILTAYFVGNKVLKHARKMARAFKEHAYANNFPEDVCVNAYRNVRHLVCTIAALAPNKLMLTDGYKISCALQGKPVVHGFTKLPEEDIELFREYILLNNSAETLPDIVGMMQSK